jgi:hypothetical protein
MAVNGVHFLEKTTAVKDMEVTLCREESWCDGFPSTLEAFLAAAKAQDPLPFF